MRTAKGSGLIWVFLALVLVMMGFALLIPLLTIYAEKRHASDLAIGLLLACYPATQLVVAPAWGRLSDRIGRKPVIVIGIAGLGLSLLWFGAANGLPTLFAARILSALLSSAAIPAAFAFAADVSSEEDRGRAMGLLGAGIGVGMLVGMGVGGELSHLGHLYPFLWEERTPFYVVGAFCLLLAPLFGALLMEPASSRRVATVEPILGGMWQALSGPVRPIFFLLFAVTFGLALLEGTFALFGERRFSLDERGIAHLLTWAILAMILTQGGLVGPLIRRLGEPAVVSLGFALGGIGFWGMLPARSVGTLGLFAALLVVGIALARPALSSYLSKVTAEGQGLTMGRGASFESLGRILGPVVGTELLGRHVGAPYWVGAAGMVLCAVLAALFLNGAARASVRTRQEAEEIIAR